MTDRAQVVDIGWILTRPSAEALPLGGWYANPVDPARAAVVARRVLAAGTGATWPLRLAGVLARMALGRPAEAEWLNLRALAPDARAAALAELVRGQLLVARRLRAGLDHLERGFRLAAPHLDAEGYLVLLRRHERLRVLPLGERPRPPAPLEALLREAGVVARLRGAPGPVPAADRRDTVG